MFTTTSTGDVIATSDAWQVDGDVLPPGATILQASGGHTNPTYYVGDRYAPNGATGMGRFDLTQQGDHLWRSFRNGASLVGRELARRVAQDLRAEARLTRASGVNLTLAERCAVARWLGAPVFVSIHAHKGGGAAGDLRSTTRAIAGPRACASPRWRC